MDETAELGGRRAGRGGRDADVERAARTLRAGRLVAFPTETVYGLGAAALDARAVARVFEVKKRPRFDPLIVHVAEAAALDELVEAVPDEVRRLVERAWPGPLTVVLPKRDRVPDLVTAGLGSVAVRVPDHPLALALLRRAGVPVAAPSANRFGGISPTSAAHVRAELGSAVDVILDGGACRVGVESTVVSFLPAGPRLLRPGGLPVEEIEALLGTRVALTPPEPAGSDVVDGGRTGGLVSPGMSSRHYSPRTPLALVGSLEEAARRAAGRRAGLLVPVRPAGASDDEPLRLEGARLSRVEELSPSGDLVEAAAALFAALRRLDAAGLDLILALPVVERGLGRAINDRLRRAAAPGEA